MFRSFEGEVDELHRSHACPVREVVASFFRTASLYWAGTSETDLIFLGGGPSSEGAGRLALGDESIDMRWAAGSTDE